MKRINILIVIAIFISIIVHFSFSNVQGAISNFTERDAKLNKASFMEDCAYCLNELSPENIKEPLKNVCVIAYNYCYDYCRVTFKYFFKPFKERLHASKTAFSNLFLPETRGSTRDRYSSLVPCDALENLCSPADDPVYSTFTSAGLPIKRTFRVYEPGSAEGLGFISSVAGSVGLCEAIALFRAPEKTTPSKQSAKAVKKAAAKKTNVASSKGHKKAGQASSAKKTSAATRASSAKNKPTSLTSADKKKQKMKRTQASADKKKTTAQTPSAKKKKSAKRAAASQKKKTIVQASASQPKKTSTASSTPKKKKSSANLKKEATSSGEEPQPKFIPRKFTKNFGRKKTTREEIYDFAPSSSAIPIGYVVYMFGSQKGRGNGQGGNPPGNGQGGNHGGHPGGSQGGNQRGNGGQPQGQPGNGQTGTRGWVNWFTNLGGGPTNTHQHQVTWHKGNQSGHPGGNQGGNEPEDEGKHKERDWGGNPDNWAGDDGKPLETAKGSPRHCGGGNNPYSMFGGNPPKDSWGGNYSEPPNKYEGPWGSPDKYTRENFGNYGEHGHRKGSPNNWTGPNGEKLECLQAEIPFNGGFNPYSMFGQGPSNDNESKEHDSNGDGQSDNGPSGSSGNGEHSGHTSSGNGSSRKSGATSAGNDGHPSNNGQNNEHQSDHPSDDNGSNGHSLSLVEDHYSADKDSSHHDDHSSTSNSSSFIMVSMPGNSEPAGNDQQPSNGNGSKSHDSNDDGQSDNGPSESSGNDKDSEHTSAGNGSSRNSGATSSGNGSSNNGEHSGPTSAGNDSHPSNNGQNNKHQSDHPSDDNGSNSLHFVSDHHSAGGDSGPNHDDHSPDSNSSSFAMLSMPGSNGSMDSTPSPKNSQYLSCEISNPDPIILQGFLWWDDGQNGGHSGDSGDSGPNHNDHSPDSNSSSIIMLSMPGSNEPSGNDQQPTDGNGSKSHDSNGNGQSDNEPSGSSGNDKHSGHTSSDSGDSGPNHDDRSSSSTSSSSSVVMSILESNGAMDSSQSPKNSQYPSCELSNPDSITLQGLLWWGNSPSWPSQVDGMQSNGLSASGREESRHSSSDGEESRHSSIVGGGFCGNDYLDLSCCAWPAGKRPDKDDDGPRSLKMQKNFFSGGEGGEHSEGGDGEHWPSNDYIPSWHSEPSLTGSEPSFHNYQPVNNGRSSDHSSDDASHKPSSLPGANGPFSGKPHVEKGDEHHSRGSKNDPSRPSKPSSINGADSSGNNSHDSSNDASWPKPLEDHLDLSSHVEGMSAPNSERHRSDDSGPKPLEDHPDQSSDVGGMSAPNSERHRSNDSHPLNCPCSVCCCDGWNPHSYEGEPSGDDSEPKSLLGWGDSPRHSGSSSSVNGISKPKAERHGSDGNCPSNCPCSVCCWPGWTPDGNNDYNRYDGDTQHPSKNNERSLTSSSPEGHDLTGDGNEEDPSSNSSKPSDEEPEPKPKEGENKSIERAPPRPKTVAPAQPLAPKLNLDSYKNSLSALREVSHVVAQETQLSMQTLVDNTNVQNISPKKRFLAFGSLSGNKPKLSQGLPYSFLIGGLARLFSNMYLGGAYSYGRQTTKDYPVTTGAPETAGSSKGRFDTHRLSGILLLNPNNPGLTSFLEYSFGGGNARVARSFVVDQASQKNKGNTTTYAHGLTARLGYRLNFLEKFNLTPYGELAFVQARAKDYSESHGRFLANISGVKERNFEKRLGLESGYIINDRLQIQLWGALAHSEKKNPSEVKAFITEHKKEVSIPKHKEKHVSEAFGTNLNVQITDNTGIRFYASLQTKQTNASLLTKSLGAAVWHSF